MKVKVSAIVDANKFSVLLMTHYFKVTCTSLFEVNQGVIDINYCNRWKG